MQQKRKEEAIKNKSVGVTWNLELQQIFRNFVLTKFMTVDSHFLKVFWILCNFFAFVGGAKTDYF